MGILKRVASFILIPLVVLYLALAAFLHVVHYPSPIAAIRLGLAPASKTPDLMPAHTIAPSSNPLIFPKGSEQMPATVDWEGKQVTWQEFLDKSNTNAFLVLRNGVLTYEYYKSGVTAATRLPSYSVAKTMTSIMIGQLVAAGKIKESDTFVKYFPEYKNGTAFDRVTIKTLLDMQGGVGVSDNYPTGPSGWGVAIAQMYATTDLNWFIAHNRKMAFEPGTQSIYRSVDTQLLGLVIKKVTGMRVADYFSKNVWQLVGASNEATWNVDRVGGTEKTFCCFNASALDYAKVGQMLINGGKVGSTVVVDPAWIKRMSTPVDTLDHGWKYSAFVWHPYPGINMALGLHGQFIFMNPATKTVIVKLSDNPTGQDPEIVEAKVMMGISSH
mgnify:CR=1 FL=1